MNWSLALYLPSEGGYLKKKRDLVVFNLIEIRFYWKLLHVSIDAQQLLFWLSKWLVNRASIVQLINLKITCIKSKNVQ